MRCQRNFQNTQAAVSLPETFSLEAFGEVVADHEKLQKRAIESAEIIRKYVEAAKSICPELVFKGEGKLGSLPES